MKKSIIFLTILLFNFFISCSDSGSDNRMPELKFDISNATALFSGSPISKQARSRNQAGEDNNKILLKENSAGDIEEAVSGFIGQFIIKYMLNNPVTDELLLLGHFNYYDADLDMIQRSQIIRIDSNSNHYGLEADDYHYYQNSGFDSTGAFYFTTGSSSPAGKSHIWKYSHNTATVLAESENHIKLNKVMNNGYIIYSIQDGDTWLRTPDGELTEWNGGTRGIYSNYSDTFYYDNKGYRFDDNEEFDSNIALSGAGDDFDAVDSSFITVSDSSIIKYQIQADKTLTETILLDQYTIEKREIDYYGDVYLIKRVGAVFYFAGKGPSGNRNLFKLTGENTVEKLLTGADDDGYLIVDASFNNDGEVTASVQRLSDGKYGTLSGDFNTDEYVFNVREGFSNISDVLLIR